MGEFLLRKCEASGGGGEQREGSFLEKGLLLVSTTADAITDGPKRRIPRHAAEDVASTGEAAEQGFRGKRTCTPARASSSPYSGDAAPDCRSVVEKGAYDDCDGETSDDWSHPPPAGGAANEKHLKGMATFIGAEQEPLRADGEQESNRRRSRLGTPVSGEHRTHSRKFESSSSTSSDLEEVPVPEESVKLESTAENRAAGSRSSSPARRRKPTRAVAPTDDEIEAFFSEIEGKLSKKFADKYNYDVVKDAPLEGRYEWIRIKP